MATDTAQRVEEIAQELFEVLTHVSLSTQSNPKRELDLKEMEFLTLSVLNSHESMIVGEIQRLLGVLPAQMSRIIRALESREPPLIECRINSRDKRKIDVRLTDAGAQALLMYQEIRVKKLTELLQPLPEGDQEELSRLAHKLTEVFEHSLEGEPV